jgi:hypothetical protein
VRVVVLKVGADINQQRAVGAFAVHLAERERLDADFARIQRPSVQRNDRFEVRRL